MRYQDNSRPLPFLKSLTAPISLYTARCSGRANALSKSFISFALRLLSCSIALYAFCMSLTFSPVARSTSFWNSSTLAR